MVIIIQNYTKKLLYFSTFEPLLDILGFKLANYYLKSYIYMLKIKFTLILTKLKKHSIIKLIRIVGNGGEKIETIYKRKIWTTYYD